MKFFLRARPHTVFLITYILPLVMSLPFITEAVTDPDRLPDIIKVIPVYMLGVYVMYFGWFWQVGTGLQEQIPAPLRYKTGKFKLALIMPLLYLLFLAGFVQYSYTSDTLLEVGPLLGVIVPVHTFAMLFILYVLYFVARTLKSAELRRRAVFREFAGEFFQIPLYPLTLWFLQPRINKLAAGK